MNTRSNLPLSAILKEARQLAALTSIIRDQFGGLTIDSREVELVGLADDIASVIFDHFRQSPTSGAAGAAYGTSGKLEAVMASIVHANSCAKLTTNEDELGALAGRIGWLQLTAGDMAEELAQQIEQLCAEGAAA